MSAPKADDISCAKTNVDIVKLQLSAPSVQMRYTSTGLDLRCMHREDSGDAWNVYKYQTCLVVRLMNIAQADSPLNSSYNSLPSLTDQKDELCRSPFDGGHGLRIANASGHRSELLHRHSCLLQPRGHSSRRDAQLRACDRAHG